MDEYKQQLCNELQEMGISITPEQRDQLLQHLSLVLDVNKTINLTRIDSVQSGITLHIVDSLILLKYLCHTEKPFLDMGTGAGFPGIPLAIVTAKKAVLCDSVKKKITAVDGFVSKLGLEQYVTTSTQRVEELAKSRRNGFDTVVARAVAALPVLVEYSTPLLMPHGRLVVTKGRLDVTELTTGNNAAQICGLSLVSHDHYELPHDAGHREILVYEKTGKSKVKLPRRVGKAKAEPLGSDR